MMDLKSLSQKKIYELSDAERDYIKAMYKSYFDATDNARLRAIGYCVVFGGVPTDKIGAIDITIAHTANGVAVGLNLGPFPILNGIEGGQGDTMAAIRDYIVREPRFAQPLNGKHGNIDFQEFHAPLFVSTKNSKTLGGRLHDCKTMLAKAGREIGFNGGKIKLYQLGAELKVCTGGFSWSQSGGLYWGETIPIRDFPFSLLGDWRSQPVLDVTYDGGICEPVTDKTAEKT